MLLPLGWLKDYVAYEGSAEEAAHLLTMSGTKIESVSGEVLEVEVTSNRGDCLSIIGLARELSAVTGLPLKTPLPAVHQSGEPIADTAAVEIAAPDLCPRYSARLLRDVAPVPSPAWMQERLIQAGLRPINAIVDVTNYVMLEYGQPLHAFDFAMLRGGTIVVRRADDGERFVTLDGQAHTLDSSILMICDAERPVAIAGIRGGQNSEVTDSTRTVLLESAHFDPVAIRTASKRLGVSTDSSYRFERGVDPSGTVAALDRAAQLLHELAGAAVAPGVIDACPRVIEPRTVIYRPERGDRLIGRTIPLEEQRRYLEGLGLAVAADGDRLIVTAPTFRPDLIQEDDLVEEVARLYGFERIPYRLPGGAFVGRISETQAFAGHIRALLRGSGLQEVLTHSLTDPMRLARFSETTPRRVLTPLSEELSVLRSTLIPMLAEVAERNAHHGRVDINLFEVGHVFQPHALDYGVDEPMRAAGLLCGSRMVGRWNVGKPAPLEADFFAAKGVVEAVCDALHVAGVRYEATSAPGMHPGRTARILAGDGEIGIVGQVHPVVQEEMDLPGLAYVFELDLDVLKALERAPAARPLPRFPAVTRDLAMLVPKETEADRVRAVLVEAGAPFLEEATLFDVYEGKGVPEGRKSLAFAVRFRSPERTLTDAEVDAAVSTIRDALAQEIGAVAR